MRKEHYVWVAFLCLDNDDDEYGARTSTMWVNRATCFFDQSPIFHCQVFFWNHLQREYISFSIDAGRDCVFLSSRKRFRRGWLFHRIVVDATQERAMYDFFVEQLAKQTRFDYVGAYALFFRPIDTGPDNWFCSKLVVAALHRARLLLGARAHATSPAALYALVLSHLAGEPTTNPIH
jgi:hypothetical protein